MSRAYWLTCDDCTLAIDGYLRAGLSLVEAHKAAQCEHLSVPHGGEWPSYEAMQADTDSR